MELAKKDIIKFIELTKHYDETSQNIGITGSIESFTRVMESLLKNVRFDTIIINESKTKYICIMDDIEICYIHLQTLSDLDGLYFREYL